MPTERYQFAVRDPEGFCWVMPPRMAEVVVAAMPGCSLWRRVERVDSVRVTHGEWHEVETAAGGGS